MCIICKSITLAIVNTDMTIIRTLEYVLANEHTGRA